MEKTEEKALAILASNLKRKKRTVDMITIAECINYLKELYGSWREVTRRADVSYEMLREFRATLELPDEVKRLVKARMIDSVEVAEEISKLDGAERQIELAKNFVSQKLTTKDIRDTVQYAKANPNLSIEKCVRRVLASKPVVEKRYMVVMELRNSTLQTLRKEAEKLSLTTEDLVKSIVEDLKVENLISCETRGKIIAITVGEGGLTALKGKARKLNVDLEELAETIVENWLVKKPLRYAK